MSESKGGESASVLGIAAKRKIKKFHLFQSQTNYHFLINIECMLLLCDLIHLYPSLMKCIKVCLYSIIILSLLFCDSSKCLFGDFFFFLFF